MFEDKTLVCKDCGEEFVFTAREQEFYESKGFVNEPQRCKPCRDKRKNAGRAPREMHDAYVLPAAALLKCRSSRGMIARYIAASALQK